MGKKYKLLGFYNYTVIITYIGMIFGFIGVYFAIKENFQAALFCLMFSGLCDMFDGAVANTLERTRDARDFGIQIDSASDLICFGVLPATIVMQYTSSCPIISFIIPCLYLLTALIRLSWFNVDELKRQRECQNPREKLLGMPVTISALLIPILIQVSSFFASFKIFICLGIMFLMSLAFLIPVQLSKPKMLTKILFILVGIAELILIINGAFLQ